MLEQLQKEKKKDSYLFLYIFVTLLFVVFAFSYYFWQKEQQNNEKPVEEVVTTVQSVPHQPVAATTERPITPPSITFPNRPITQQFQALLKCTDPRTGAVSLAKTCPSGFIAEKIETQDHAGIRPSRYRHTPSTNQNQQGQITVIRDYRQEVKKCDDYYDPLIKDIMDNQDYMFNAYWKKRLNYLRNLKDKCVQAANRGKARIFPV